MRIILGGIILAAFLIRVYNLNYNTPFLDEAQYIALGRHILDGETEVGTSAIHWIGGYPFMFPVISAAFYNVGGIVMSRFFVALLGTFCVFLMYQFTKQLMIFKDKKTNQVAGLIAAACMAITASAIITSRSAIYDGLAFPLFFAGVVLFHKALYSGEKWFYMSAAVVLFLSFLAKYIVIIYFPLLLLIPILVALQLKRFDCLKGTILSFCLPLIILTAVYVGFHGNELKTFLVEQGVISKASQLTITRIFFEYTGVAFLLSFLAMALLWRSAKLLLAVLLLFSFLPLIVHALTGNGDSIQQHTIFSFIFLLPAAGAGLAYLLKKHKKIGVAVLVLVLLIQIFISVPQVKASSFWPNITGAANAIREDLDPSDRVLAESDDSMYLELKENIPQEQISGPFGFTYASTSGERAYTEAIQNRYFQFIQLDGMYFEESEIKAMEKALDKKYRKIYDKGSMRVYEVEN